MGMLFGQSFFNRDPMRNSSIATNGSARVMNGCRSDQQLSIKIRLCLATVHGVLDTFHAELGLWAAAAVLGGGFSKPARVMSHAGFRIYTLAMQAFLQRSTETAGRALQFDSKNADAQAPTLVTHLLNLLQISRHPAASCCQAALRRAATGLAAL